MRKCGSVFVILGIVAGIGGGCTHYNHESAGGEVFFNPADAAKTVVMHVNNRNPVSMELRTIVNGRSEFVGSVGGVDSTDVVLDSSLFPTGVLYLVAIPSDGGGRAVVGPLSANKGDRVTFSVAKTLSQSRATVVR